MSKILQHASGIVPRTKLASNDGDSRSEAFRDSGMWRAPLDWRDNCSTDNTSRDEEVSGNTPLDGDGASADGPPLALDHSINTPGDGDDNDNTPRWGRVAVAAWGAGRPLPGSGCTH